MKAWKKPAMIKVNSAQLNEMIQAAAFTCMFRFLR